jgi:hypothetical protein
MGLLVLPTIGNHDTTLKATMLRDEQLAELSVLLKWNHLFSELSSWVVNTRFLTNIVHQHGGICIHTRSTAEPVHAVMELISIKISLDMTLMSLNSNNAMHNSILGESLLYRSHFSLASDKLDFKMYIFIRRLKINYSIQALSVALETPLIHT